MDLDRAIVSQRHRLGIGLVTGAILGHLWWRLRWFVFAVSLAGVGLAAMGLSRGRTELQLAGAVVFLYGVLCLPVAAFRGAMKRARFSNVERVLRITGEGVETRGAFDEPASVGWELFGFARRGKGLWMLYLLNGLFLVVPDFAFEPSELKDLGTLIRGKLAVK